MSGKEMAEGLEKEDWGTLAVNSSRIFVNRENAGRTGYSWSVMMIAMDHTQKHGVTKSQDELQIQSHFHR